MYLHFFLHWIWVEFLVICALDLAMSTGAPVVAHRLEDAGNRRAALRILNVMLRVPSLGLFSWTKRSVRYSLACMSYRDGNYAQAETLFRALLKERLAPGREGDIRRRLSDTLDSLGQTYEADSEQQKAQTATAKSTSAASLMTRGDLLRRENRFDEAFAVYEKILSMGGTQPKHTRASVMVKMSLAAEHAGKPKECVIWAEAAINEGLTGTSLRAAHSLAAISYANLSKFDRALKHRDAAYKCAVESNDQVAAAESLAAMAELLKKQGRLDEALEVCDRGIADVSSTKIGYVAKSEILQAMGRFDESLEAMKQSAGGTGMNSKVSYDVGRSTGIFNLGSARILFDMDRPSEAWDFLQKATVTFANDARLLLMCETLSMRILASQGRGDQAREKMRYVRKAMAQFAENRNLTQSALVNLGWTELTLGEPSNALKSFEEYMVSAPDPVWKPRGNYLMGECYRELGEPDSARCAYTDALSYGVETQYTKLSRQALEKLKSPTD